MVHYVGLGSFIMSMASYATCWRHCAP